MDPASTDLAATALEGADPAGDLPGGARRPPTRPDLVEGGIRLRAHRVEDLPDLLAQCQDPIMQRWTSIPVPYTARHARAYLACLEPEWDAGRSYGFALERDGRYAGTLDLRPDGAAGAGVGFALAPWARGQGSMGAALRLALPWGFEALDLDAVHWRAQVGNWASRRVAWSVGFRYDGAVRDLLPRGAGSGRAREPRRHDAWVATLRRGEPLEPEGRWLRAPALSAPGVFLRPHDEKDVPRIVEACADEQTQRWLPTLPSPYTERDAQEHLADIAEGHAAGRRLAWAVADPVGGRLLAEVSVFGLGGGSRRGEVGYWAHPDARGRRVVTNAVRAAVGYALTLRSAAGGLGLGLDAVLLRAAEGNAASVAVAGAAGFRLAGRDSRAERLRDGTVLDLLRYERLA